MVLAQSGDVEWDPAHLRAIASDGQEGRAAQWSAAARALSRCALTMAWYAATVGQHSGEGKQELGSRAGPRGSRTQGNRRSRGYGRGARRGEAEESVGTR